MKMASKDNVGRIFSSNQIQIGPLTEEADHEKKDGGDGDDDNVDRRVIERSTLFMQFTDIMTRTPSLPPS